MKKEKFWIKFLTNIRKIEKELKELDYIDDEFVNTNYINARQGKLTQASYNSEKIVSNLSN